MSPTVKAYVIDPLERAVRTFVQQFAVVLMAGGTTGLLAHQYWALAADSAAFAAAVSILTSVATFWVSAQSPSVDLALRVLKTFLQSFLGTLTASAVLSLSGADWKGALAVAVPTALTALLTGLTALALPGTDGASLLPEGTGVAVDDAESDQSEVDVEAEAQRDALAEVDDTGLVDDTSLAEDVPEHGATAV